MTNIMDQIDLLIAEFKAKFPRHPGIHPKISDRICAPNRLEIPTERMKEFCDALPPMDKDLVLEESGLPKESGLEPLIYKRMTVRVGTTLQVWRITRSKK